MKKLPNNSRFLIYLAGYLLIILGLFEAYELFGQKLKAKNSECQLVESKNILTNQKFLTTYENNGIQVQTFNTEKLILNRYKLNFNSESVNLQELDERSFLCKDNYANCFPNKIENSKVIIENITGNNQGGLIQLNYNNDIKIVPYYFKDKELKVAHAIGICGKPLTQLPKYFLAGNVLLVESDHDNFFSLFHLNSEGNENYFEPPVSSSENYEFTKDGSLSSIDCKEKVKEYAEFSLHQIEDYFTLLRTDQGEPLTAYYQSVNSMLIKKYLFNNKNEIIDFPITTNNNLDFISVKKNKASLEPLFYVKEKEQLVFQKKINTNLSLKDWFSGQAHDWYGLEKISFLSSFNIYLNSNESHDFIKVHTFINFKAVEKIYATSITPKSFWLTLQAQDSLDAYKFECPLRNAD